jgi:putative transposase
MNIFFIIKTLTFETYKYHQDKLKTMYQTLPIKITPTSDQEELLWILSEKCRLLYNFALAERKDAYSNDIKISYIKQQNDLPKTKKQYPEYKWVYSKVLQSVLKRLDANYKSFFSLKKNGDETAKPPKFRGEGYFFTMTYNQSGFEITDSKANNITYNSTDTTNYLYGKSEPVYTEDDEVFISFHISILLGSS